MKSLSSTIHHAIKECVGSAVVEQFQEWFDCIPPWYLYNQKSQLKNQTCPNDQSAMRKNESEFDAIIDDLGNMKSNFPIANVKRKCLPPCVITDIKVRYSISK